MGFQEGYEGWQKGRWSQEEAARIQGTGEQSFKRYRDRYEEKGMEGCLRSAPHPAEGILSVDRSFAAKPDISSFLTAEVSGA